MWAPWQHVGSSPVECVVTHALCADNDTKAQQHLMYCLICSKTGLFGLLYVWGEIIHVFTVSGHISIHVHIYIDFFLNLIEIYYI